MKLMRCILILVLCLLFAVLSPALGQRVELLIEEGGEVKNPPESLELQYKFKVGEKRRYDVTITGSGAIRLPAQKEHSQLLARTEMTFIQYVTAYDPTKGIWRMEWNTVKGLMTIPEFGEMSITVPRVDFEMDKYGSIGKWKGLDGGGITPGQPEGKVLGDIFRQLKFAGFPRKAVHLNDEWEDKYTIQLPDEEPIAITCTSKLIAFERVNDHDCAKILTKYTTPFKLKLKDEKATDSPGGAESKEKPMVIIGKEIGEFCTHFAYEEGKIIQSFGSIELLADVKAMDSPEAEKGIDTAQEESAAVPADPAAGEPLPQPPKHDVSVKYEMVMHFNPKNPKFAEEN